MFYFKNIQAQLNNVIKPERRFSALNTRIRSIAGRSAGQIVSPRRSNFAKRIYRFIDFKRIVLPGQYGLVLRNHYDPDRSAPICLVCYPIGVFIHILKPSKISLGDIIQNRAVSPSNSGDSSTLFKFSSGHLLHNISLYPNRTGQLTRSAGCSTILVRKETDHALLKLKSGELRYVNCSVTATLGAVGGETHFLRNYKYAGVMRRLGKRSRTRPSAMNPVDHPLGGRTRGGTQAMNKKGIITLNRPSVKTRHPAILYTRRQMKFRRF